jgi:hypothetical protein
LGSREEASSPQRAVEKVVKRLEEGGSRCRNLDSQSSPSSPFGSTSSNGKSKHPKVSSKKLSGTPLKSLSKNQDLLIPEKLLSLLLLLLLLLLL